MLGPRELLRVLASNTLLVSEFPPCVTTMFAFILWCTCFSVIEESGCGHMDGDGICDTGWALVLRESGMFEVGEQEMQRWDFY